MAATKRKPHARQSAQATNPSLQALRAAALALPGLAVPGSGHAAEGDVGFQYGRYEESERNLFGVDSRFDPIQVDTLQGVGNFTLLDRIKFAFVYTQDTWSGATPVSTAPRDMRGNRVRTADGVSGATPIINAPVLFDSKFNVLRTDGFGNLTGGIDNQLVHTLSSASPETRKQSTFKLGYEWDEAALDVGGGISLERDYESHFVNLGGRLDFNQKLTTLNMGLSYTGSDIDSRLDHDAIPYIDTTAFDNQIETPEPDEKILHGDRTDWGASLGVTQVLGKNSLVTATAGYTYSTGYMENPYKVVQVAFIDPAQQFLAPPGGFFGDVQALLEQRPNQRHQWTGNLRYIQYVSALDAAVRFDYRYFHDDWGIDAHTFEANWGQPLGDGWTVTPRIRYYSQDEADFYTPFVISRQAHAGFDPRKLPANFSSDHRLSGYGALSGGVTVSKQFAKGVSLEAGFEYYTHAGDLKLGGDGEDDFADFDYFVANAALKVNLSALSLAGLGDDDTHSAHSHQHSVHAPAGVMFDHMLKKAGDMMVGYRYMYANQDGDMLHGSESVGDLAVVNNACPGTAGCLDGPEEMRMHMHMLNLMYAPSDWLNLMLMPTFVDMDMDLRDLAGAPPEDEDAHDHSGGHSTGVIGDTGMFAMIKLFDTPMHHMHVTLGVTAPSGDVDVKLRDNHQQIGGFIHYGMQLGSGTWDFVPSITYTGHMDDWSWGAQVSGTKRLESENESGFAFGDILQTTAWTSYRLANWLSASVRGIYTVQGSIKGAFDGIQQFDTPMDFPSNYGGRYWDVGFGLNAFVPRGDLAGNRLSFEWIQPVEDDVNGYQLERDSALSVSWSYAF